MSFLSPCVLPIVPAYIAIITGPDIEQLRDAERPMARIARDTVLFVAGFSAVLVLLGLSATTHWDTSRIAVRWRLPDADDRRAAS